MTFLVPIDFFFVLYPFLFSSFPLSATAFFFGGQKIPLFANTSLGEKAIPFAQREFLGWISSHSIAPKRTETKRECCKLLLTTLSVSGYSKTLGDVTENTRRFSQKTRRFFRKCLRDFYKSRRFPKKDGSIQMPFKVDSNLSDKAKKNLHKGRKGFAQGEKKDLRKWRKAEVSTFSVAHCPWSWPCPRS